MSIERSRRKAYSSDIRWRIVWQRIAMDFSYRAIAHNLNISIGTVCNILKQFEQDGNVDSKHPRKQPEKCKLDNHHVIGLILDNPSLYLREICSKAKETTNTEVSPSTICRMLALHGINKKKIQHIAIQKSLRF